MINGPERIWAWINYDGDWDGTWLASSQTLQPDRLPDAGYIRADIVVAKLAEAREGALREATTIELIEELRRRPSRPPETGVEKRPLIQEDKTDE